MSFLVKRPKRSLSEILLANLNKGNEEVRGADGLPMKPEEKMRTVAEHFARRAKEKEEPVAQ